MKKTEQRVINFIKSFDLIQSNDKVLIAFSGGPDSVFALYFFYKFRKKYNIEISAIHFNHQLRGIESDEDEMFCKNLCSKLSIDFSSKKLNVLSDAKKNKISIEESARNLRYKYLTKHARKFKIDKVITAHNQSDNSETILMNMISGTGIDGLSGIPVKRDVFIRPLLCLPKAEILNYLNSQKINYRIDSSNFSNDFRRNIIRNEIIPVIIKKLNPSIDSALFRSSINLSKISDQIDDMARRIVNKSMSFKKGELVIPDEIINSEASSVLIKSALWHYLGYKANYSEIRKIIAASSLQKGKIITLRDNMLAAREPDGICVKRRTKSEFPSLKMRIGETVLISDKDLSIQLCKKDNLELSTARNVEYVDASKLRGNFNVRIWKPGDRFLPLGRKTEKKVSDFLTDAKISASAKKSQYVLENRNNIVWVVGLRIDDRFKITDKTSKVYKLILGN